MTMNKNEIIKVEIEDFTKDGEGIGHADGYTLFVKDAVIGDVVLARITGPKKGYAYARVEEIISPSQDRIDGRCPEARRCGGCRLQEYRYEKQLEFKRRLVENALRRIGGFEIVDAAGEVPGDRAADAAGEVPGDRAVNTAGDRPGDRAADTAGDVPEDRTVDAAGDRPGDRAADAAGEVPGDRTADKPVKYTGRVGIQPVIGMETPWRYRNKAQYPVASVRTAEGSVRTEAGFYAGRTHSLIPVRDCVLTGQANQRILSEILIFMERNHIPAYDEKSGEGLIRHVLIREGFVTGEIMVCPVINGDRLPKASKLVEALARIPGVKSICINVNKSRGNVILGDRTAALYGKPWITDELGGLKFRISPRSFFQVNHVQTEVLYSKVLELASLTGNETVYDLYCGIGTISLYLAKHAGTVYGVEIIPDAVRDARENAERNGIGNVHFYTGAAEDLVVSGEFAPGVPCPPADVIVLDPPRKGCAPSLIQAVLRMAPQRIVYVSCDPATLARDLKLFAEGNGEISYRPDYVQPVDMFPQTMHVETVVLMSKVKE